MVERDNVRGCSGGACDAEYCRLCRGDNREKGVVDQMDVWDVPRVMGRGGLRRACGRCPGIAEDSTLHWRVA
jgi:hypothetical protein